MNKNLMWNCESSIDRTWSRCHDSWCLQKATTYLKFIGPTWHFCWVQPALIKHIKHALFDIKSNVIFGRIYNVRYISTREKKNANRQSVFFQVLGSTKPRSSHVHTTWTWSNFSLMSRADPICQSHKKRILAH